MRLVLGEKEQVNSKHLQIAVFAFNLALTSNQIATILSTFDAFQNGAQGIKFVRTVDQRFIDVIGLYVSCVGIGRNKGRCQSSRRWIVREID